jgi:hypothetical protein
MPLLAWRGARDLARAVGRLGYGSGRRPAAVRSSACTQQIGTAPFQVTIAGALPSPAIP